MNSLWLESVLKKHDYLNEVAQVVEIKSEDALAKGENFASRVSRVYIKLLLRSGKTITKKLIMKTSSEFEFMNRAYSLFLYEIKTYELVLSSMERLMEELGDLRSKLWCGLFGYNANDMIALEDLSDEGYVVAKRQDCMDLEHSFLVLKSIGRFHAMSKMLIERGQLSEKDYPRHFFAFESELSDIICEASVKLLGDAIETDWPKEMRKIGLKVSAQAANTSKRLKELVEVSENRFNVLNHGDIWTCNLMFKYYEGAPVNVKFVDFQRCHYNSYMWDFLFFVYSSVVPELRRRHFKKLLEVYLDSLRKNLEYFGFEGEIPSLAEAEEESERLDFLSFYLMTATYAVTTTDVPDAFAFDKFQKTGDRYSPFKKEVWTAPKYIQDTKEDFENFVKKKTI